MDSTKILIDFISKNKTFFGSLSVFILFLLTYMIYNKFHLKIGEFEIGPPLQTPAVITQPPEQPVGSIRVNQESENPEISTTNRPPKTKNPNPPSVPKPEPITNKVIIHEADLRGNINVEDGEKAIGAIVTCLDCENTNSVITNQSGEFTLPYKIKANEKNEFPKQITLNIIYKNQPYKKFHSTKDEYININIRN
jgi:hypothetical protein